MDANGSVKVSLGGSKLYGHSVPLGDLTSIRTHIMEPNHTLLEEMNTVTSLYSIYMLSFKTM